MSVWASHHSRATSGAHLLLFEYLWTKLLVLYIPTAGLFIHLLDVLYFRLLFEFSVVPQRIVTPTPFYITSVTAFWVLAQVVRVTFNTLRSPLLSVLPLDQNVVIPAMFLSWFISCFVWKILQYAFISGLFSKFLPPPFFPSFLPLALFRCSCK